MLLIAANEQFRVVVPATAYSLPGFREWAASASFPELGKVTYYQGEIFLDMSPERARSHNQVKSEICRVLGNLVAEQDLGELYQDGIWLTHDDAELSNEPDGMFVSWQSLESGRIRLIATEPDGDGIEMRGAHRLGSGGCQQELRDEGHAMVTQGVSPRRRSRVLAGGRARRFDGLDDLGLAR